MERELFQKSYAMWMQNGHTAVMLRRSIIWKGMICIIAIDKEQLCGNVCDGYVGRCYLQILNHAVSSYQTSQGIFSDNMLCLCMQSRFMQTLYTI